MIYIHAGSSLIGDEVIGASPINIDQQPLFMICIMIGRGPINLGHHPLLTRWLTCNKPVCGACYPIATSCQSKHIDYALEKWNDIHDV